MVTDSLQNPLPYASVMAKPQDSLLKIQFSITDEQGQYQLSLKNISYSITVNYMGYVPYTFTINPNKKEATRNIALKEKAEELEEVVVKIPIVVKKDTIVYNVNELTNGHERKLKDVLKKLPGIEVSKDGVITVQGKKITTVLVENKKFFGGGSKLAIDNIPANALAQVEIIDHYTEIPLLKDLVDSDKMAMNIKLKEDKKNFAFGDIKAGKGNEDYYNIHSNLFYYSPKTTVNFIGNTNNIANQVFTYQQYFDFQSGLNQTFTKGNTNFEMPNDDFLQFIESNDAVTSKRKFAALNITKEINNKLNVSGYAIFSNTNEETFNLSTNQYNTFTEQKSLGTTAKNIFAIGNIQTTYLPNVTDAWYFKTKFKKTNNKYQNTINSLVNTTNNMFLTVKKAKDVFFNQAVEWHRKRSYKHAFSFAANYTFEEDTPHTTWQTSDVILQEIIPVIQDSLYTIKQQKQTRNHKFDVILKHYWILNKNNHIYSTLGNTYYNQTFFTNDTQKLTNGNTNNFSNENFGNNLNFNLNDLFVGIDYKFKQGIFTLSQGAFLHYYSWKINQQYKTIKHKAVVLPNFSVKAEFNKLNKMELGYQKTTSFYNVAKFARNYYLQAYNTVFKGNDSLKNEVFHNFNVRYNKFNRYKGVSIYAIAKYITKTKGTVNNVNYSGINNTVYPIFLNNPEKRWSFLGNIKKPVKNINYSLRLNYNITHYLQQISGTTYTNKNNSLSYNITARTLFDKFPVIEAGFKQSIGAYTLSGNKSTFSTNEPFFNIDYDFLKGFSFSFDYSAYTYKNKSLNQQNNYNLSNASLYYRQDNSAWSFEIAAQNLFNVKFKNQNSFSSYIISDTKTYILPQIVMFSISYNL
ncbi:carboxypeptidase-like regulatory domain-containing protein [Zhouia sp. PK063]|uniref:carboxypeptidase-like regulatory domain-containing protein n=1 Tax=Zhouia sp. PK063 TaxID=3373602 RepID=UPI0037A0D14D